MQDRAPGTQYKPVAEVWRGDFGGWFLEGMLADADRVCWSPVQGPALACFWGSWHQPWHRQDGRAAGYRQQRALTLSPSTETRELLPNDITVSFYTRKRGGSNPTGLRETSGSPRVEKRVSPWETWPGEAAGRQEGRQAQAGCVPQGCQQGRGMCCEGAHRDTQGLHPAAWAFGGYAVGSQAIAPTLHLTAQLAAEGLREGTGTRGTAKAKPQPWDKEKHPNSSPLTSSPGGASPEHPSAHHGPALPPGCCRLLQIPLRPVQEEGR